MSRSRRPDKRIMLSIDLGAEATQALERLLEARRKVEKRRTVTKTELLRELILDACAVS